MTAPAKSPPRLGAGWQYNAYDLGQGRVLKVPRSHAERMRIALSLYGTMPGYSRAQAAAWAENVHATTMRSYCLLEQALPHIDAALLGNPTLLGHGIYEQDRLVILADAFARHGFTTNTDTIDAFIETTHTLWRWGLGEGVFNFTVNFGIAASGAVVLCDLGELTQCRSTVGRAIANQVWLERWSFANLPDERLRSYAQAALAAKVIPARLEGLWGTLRTDTQP